MKRWWVAVLLALVATIPVIAGRYADRSLLQDTDTAYLLKVVRERQAPFSWFAGDWPLQNHFYRPLPTLTFELDNRLYGSNAAGYGWTNAILCALCVLTVYWLLFELWMSPVWAFAGAFVFSLWNLDRGDSLGWILPWIALTVACAGLLRHGLRGNRYLPAALVLYFLAGELSVQESAKSVGLAVLGWLPGRTASVMTVFAMIACAAYVRFERARDRRLPPLPPTPLDKPRAMPRAPARPVLWLILSLVATVLAFCSYEQAVMLPAVILGLGVYLRLGRRLPSWPTHIAYWLVLIAYLLFRHAIIPSGVSGYQAQQFRHGPGVWQDLAGYILPNAVPLMYALVGASESFFALLTSSGLSAILGFASTLATAFQARRNLVPILGGWALSIVAFLPMAWLKPFGHYHYWPLALRTILVLGLAKLAWDLASIAVCPPALQAPPRPSPAPGSLPRP